MTRNCQSAEYLFPSINSYFSCRNTLISDLQVYTLQQQNSSKHCLAIIDIEHLRDLMLLDGHLDELVKWLSPDEEKIFTSFSYPKRQAEWLGGRIACKSAVSILINGTIALDTFSFLAILPRSNGSPELHSSFPDNAQVAVSISHSKKYAVGMASYAFSCGVDIQKISSQTQKVQSKFTEPDETALLEDELPELQNTQHLSLLWSAKEALKKSLLHDQPVIFQGVMLKTIRTGKHLSLYFLYPGSGTHQSEVKAVIAEDYILAFTTKSVHHAGTP